MLRYFGLAMSCVLAVGCSDPEPRAPSDGASGMGADAGSGSIAAGGDGAVPVGDAGAGGTAGAPEMACNDLELDDVPAFSLAYDENPAPEAMGGEIPDGTYFVTEQIIYETASGPMLELGRIKVTIADGVWQEISGDAEPDSLNPDRTTTNTFEVADLYVKLTRACPQLDLSEELDFTANEDGFTLYVLDGGSWFGTVFTRQ